ncbi:sensor histidine kinase [Nocardioides sp.]|uniref:sensor histidine kinase n=1 Tax=Nocardioides sp. TaxID=35761 RepID=UPI0035141C47
MSPRATAAQPTLRRRLIGVAALMSGLAALLFVVVGHLLLDAATGTTLDRVLRERADAVAAGVRTDDAGRLQVPEVLLTPGVVVYDATGRAVAGSPPPAEQRLFAELATSTEPVDRSRDDRYQARALPFTTPDGAAGVVVVSEPRDPYESGESTALLISLTAGALLVAVSVGVAAWTGRRALAPVAAMAATAQEWSSTDLERRFGLGPPTDEIRALGATLDGLLGRVAGAIRAEQRLTAELAHELRTPLTVLHGTLDLLALRADLDEETREDVAEMLAATRTMAATMTSLLDLARSGGGSTEGLCAAPAMVAEAVRFSDDADRVALGPVPDVLLRVPGALAVRALAPVLANALRHGDAVELTGTLEGDLLRLRITDDGPGVTAAPEDLFIPGHSGAGSTGLGLPLARRVARSVGGDVVAAASPPTGGAAFDVLLPLASD